MKSPLQRHPLGPTLFSRHRPTTPNLWERQTPSSQTEPALVSAPTPYQPPWMRHALLWILLTVKKGRSSRTPSASACPPHPRAHPVTAEEGAGEREEGWPRSPSRAFVGVAGVSSRAWGSLRQPASRGGAPTAKDEGRAHLVRDLRMNTERPPRRPLLLPCGRRVGAGGGIPPPQAPPRALLLRCHLGGRDTTATSRAGRHRSRAGAAGDRSFLRVDPGKESRSSSP
jgi:hypothetical protein